MSGEKKLLAAAVILGAATVATSGVAVLYRSRAAEALQQRDTAQRAAAAAESGLSAAREQAARARAAATVPRPAPAEEVAPAGADEALLARVRELEAALAERQARTDAARQRGADGTPRAERGTWDPAAWMENMKQNDPERYAEFVRRRDEMRRRVNDAFAERAAHFLEYKTPGMTEQETQAYEDLLGLLEETWRLTEDIRLDLPPEDLRTAMRAIGENVRALQPLLQSERERELRSLATQMGYTGAQAQGFVDHVDSIYEATSARAILPRGGRGGFPGGRRGGPGAGGQPAGGGGAPAGPGR